MRVRGFVLGCVTVAGVGLLWASAALGCQPGGYSYAGFGSSTRGFGVRAEITPLPALVVGSGHVAGWVGVGGRGEGPRGADEWLQVGLSSFPGDQGVEVYYEVTLPGSAPSYHVLATGWGIGEIARVAILELAGRPNVWRVWLNGSPASAPIRLPSSHGRWYPTATAESLDKDAGCNSFLYRFHDVSIARAPGGSWQSLTAGYPISSAATRVQRGQGSSFLAAQGSDALSLMVALKR
jgi:hypothetical protein